jgi:hypothetical protein
VQNPARIDHPKTASGPESSFSLTRQAQTNRYDRRTARKDLAAAAACDVRDSCWLLRCCLQLPPARRRPAAWLARGIASRLAGRRGITGSLGPAATGAVAQHHSCAPVAAAAVGSYGIWCS